MVTANIVIEDTPLSAQTTGDWEEGDSLNIPAKDLPSKDRQFLRDLEGQEVGVSFDFGQSTNNLDGHADFKGTVRRNAVFSDPTNTSDDPSKFPEAPVVSEDAFQWEIVPSDR